jgi:hypothetical protein
MRPGLLALISGLVACADRAPPIDFSPASTPRALEIESRHRLALDLSIGFGAEVEQQRWVQQGASRVRVERQAGGVVVRWLEQAQREGEVATPGALEGQAVLVTAAGVEPLDVQRAWEARHDDVARAWARTLEADGLQVALLQRPVVPRERAARLEQAFTRLALDALGPGAALEEVRLVPSTATPAVAVFDVMLAARTNRGGTVMSCTLDGTLTVARQGAVPLSLSLEGPATVEAKETESAPALHASGTMHLERRTRQLDELGSVVAER